MSNTFYLVPGIYSITSSAPSKWPFWAGGSLSTVMELCHQNAPKVSKGSNLYSDPAVLSKCIILMKKTCPSMRNFNQSLPSALLLKSTKDKIMERITCCDLKCQIWMVTLGHTTIMFMWPMIHPSYIKCVFLGTLSPIIMVQWKMEMFER